MPLSILVIEDDQDIRMFLKALLRTEGHQVKTAQNGADALRQLGDDLNPDLIVVDLMMPKMNGWEFRRVQRRTEQIQDIPIIIVSGVSDTADPERKLSPDAILRKPLDPDAFLETVGRFNGEATSRA